MKKGLKIVLAVLLGFFALGCIVGGFAIGETGMWITGIIIAIITVKVSGLLPSDKKKAEAKAIAKAEEKERLEKLGFLGTATLIHEAGLPIAENVQCKINYFKDKIVIEGSGATFNLPTDKIMDISIKTETEIETFYNSSIGRAVAGAFVLGPIGAMIGGRTRKKEVRKTEEYLIITYDKDDKVNFVVFNTKSDPFKASKLIKIFKQSSIKSHKTIDL